MFPDQSDYVDGWMIIGLLITLLIAACLGASIEYHMGKSAKYGASFLQSFRDQSTHNMMTLTIVIYFSHLFLRLFGL